MPAPTITPILRTADPDAAIDFLGRAFGFEEHAVYRDDDGKVVHAELKYGDGLVMLGEGPEQGSDPAYVYVVVPDADAHHARAVAAGATITMELRDTDYGSRDYGATDPDGNRWGFGTYQPQF